MTFMITTSKPIFRGSYQLNLEIVPFEFWFLCIFNAAASYAMHMEMENIRCLQKVFFCNTPCDNRKYFKISVKNSTILSGKFTCDNVVKKFVVDKFQTKYRSNLGTNSSTESPRRPSPWSCYGKCCEPKTYKF